MRSTRRQTISIFAATALWGIADTTAAQGDTVKIGVILPMTGPSASTGKQIDAAIKLWIAQNGNKAGARARFYHEVVESHLARIVRVDLKSEAFTYSIDDCSGAFDTPPYGTERPFRTGLVSTITRDCI